jgi:Eukaryotic glutathione synthase, ATP binding domain
MNFLEVIDIHSTCVGMLNNRRIASEDIIASEEMNYSYPPRLPSNAISFLLTTLIDYAHSHGLIIRDKSRLEDSGRVTSIPALTLFPSLFPRTEWEHAIGLQPVYNELYARRQ